MTAFASWLLTLDAEEKEQWWSLQKRRDRSEAAYGREPKGACFVFSPRSTLGSGELQAGGMLGRAGPAWWDQPRREQQRTETPRSCACGDEQSAATTSGRVYE